MKFSNLMLQILFRISINPSLTISSELGISPVVPSEAPDFDKMDCQDLLTILI